MQGSIFLNRKLLDSAVFASEKRLKIWIWLLLKANYKNSFLSVKIGKGESIIEIERGQLLFGRFKAEETLNIDGSTIYKILQYFESEEMIEIKSNNHYTIISICNYDIYQQSEKTKVTAIKQPLNSQLTTIEQPCNTYNNDNKDNNANKDNNVITWRDNFETYKSDLRKVYQELINDSEFIQNQEKYHPGVEIALSLEKACVNFWATEAGWKHKKKSRSKEIDLKSTLINAIDMNKVYKATKKDAVNEKGETYFQMLDRIAKGE